MKITTIITLTLCVCMESCARPLVETVPSAPPTPGEPAATLDITPVPIDWAAQRASVAEAVRTGQHPERLSTFVAPTAFDHAAWAADRRGYAWRYAAVIEPGRAMHDAPDDGAEHPPLRLISSGAFAIPPEGTAEIVLHAPPFAPISALSPDKGTFGNGYPYTTVVANAAGVARIALTAGPGVINAVRVYLASPVARGTIEIVANVHPSGKDNP